MGLPEQTEREYDPAGSRDSGLRCTAQDSGDITKNVTIFGEVYTYLSVFMRLVAS